MEHTDDHNATFPIQSVLKRMSPAFLNYSDYNVISVDWSPLAPSPCYVQATYNVALVGNCTAQLLDEMVRLGVTPLDNIHVIGFSLGGQVAGNIANYIQSGKLTRITGEGTS